MQLAAPRSMLPAPNLDSPSCATHKTPLPAGNGGWTASKTSRSRWPSSAVALTERAAGDVQARCRGFLRRLDDAPLPLDDLAEIAAAVELIQDRVKYGLHQRLRKLLLPLVTAVESQMEVSE